MSHYPVFLDPRGRRPLVVAGGVIADQKVARLLRAEAADARRCGALVNVVEPPEQSGFVAPVVLERVPHHAVASISGSSPPFAGSGLVERLCANDHHGVDRLRESLVGEAVKPERLAVAWE